MKVLAACVVAAGSSIGLLGCGSDSSPAPSPPAVAYPKSVGTVWKNHFDAFAGFNIDKIMKDYNDDSVVSIFRDNCGVSTDGKGFLKFKGPAKIKEMFNGLFTQLGNKLENVDKVGPVNAGTQEGAPKVIEGAGAGGNVFLTWATKNLEGTANEIKYATDTFSFKQTGEGDYKIFKQNIVVTEPQKTTCDAIDPQSDLNPPVDPLVSNIDKAWDNHFKAFAKGDAGLTDIMKDYSDDSILQVYNFADNKFEVHDTKAKIEQFFKTTYATLGADPNNWGIGVPLQQVDNVEKSVFLVWTSTNIPHATDTFIFDDAGDSAIILRQNIVLRPASRVQIEV